MIFGVILPYLISAKNTSAVAGGIFIITALAFGSIWCIGKIIRNFKKQTNSVLPTIFVLFLFSTLMSCSKVPAGYVGIKVYLLGGDKGVDTEELPVGRYWIGINEDLFLFPTFQVNYVWTKSSDEGSPNDESITFQTKEGLEVNGDFGISFRIDPKKTTILFQKYRRGIEEITNIFIRNMVRDAINGIASTLPMENIYGEGKQNLINEVQLFVNNQTEPEGLIINKIYLIGSFRLPQSVVNALNSKIEATQKAQQRENEIREAEATAKKMIAQAEGEARSTLIIAEAEAKAIRLKAASVTPSLIQYEAVQTWDGKMPQVTGQNVPFINLK